MSTIGKLLGSSPFRPLQHHMDQVAKCVAKMGECLEALEQGQWDKMDALAGQASQLEHQADQIKDDIRSKLLRRFFMPINRSQVLEILSIQDNVADAAEDIAVLLTLKQIETPESFISVFREFHEMNSKAFGHARLIISELDELSETGFGGAEADKIRGIVHETAYAEHQCDVLQRKLLKGIFSAELSAADLVIWTRLVRELGRISNLAENLADRIEMTLNLK